MVQVMAEQSLDVETLAQAMPVRTFRGMYPHLHKSDQALWGELKQRHSNGLAEAGAIVATRTPGRTKAQLRIIPARYFDWLRKHSDAA